MPPRKQKQNQSSRNSNQKSEANNDHAVTSKTNQNKNSSSDDEQDDNDIFKGFSVLKNTKPIVLTLPFAIKPSVTIEDFNNTLLPACDAILQIHYDETENQIEFSQIHRRMAQAISKTSQITTAYESLCQRLKAFCDELPHQISLHFKKAENIGIFWNTIEDKINKIMILFDSLSYKSKTIPEIFSQYCSEAFKSNIEYFNQASQLIIETYDQFRSKRQRPPIDSSIQFLKETGLFNDYFIPLFINSVIKQIEPKINQCFESSPFSEYLETATEISENELELATIFNDYSLSHQLADQINQLIFSSKKDTIYDKCLRPLLRGQEIDSIWTCSKLARSTNAFNSFIREMASLFEEEATNCFNTNSNDDNDEQDESNDPISKLLRLYKSLTLFCSRACGPQSTRTVRSAFENGFSSQPEMVAQLLALSVHHLFTNKENYNKNSNEIAFDHDIIDQYVGLFRMLPLNDVFETYHTQLLTRRILTMKDEMVAPEMFFIEKLKQQCGAEYTCRMEELLQDRAVSRDLSIKFVEQNLSLPENSKKSTKSTKNNKDIDEDEIIPESYIRPFRCLVLPSQIAKTWASLKKVEMSPPWPISLLLSKFSNYYKENMPKRKIEWNLQLTTVKLIVANIPGLKKVKCSGDFAIILLAFNNGSRNDRIRKLRLKLKDIEKGKQMIQNKKSSKKVGKSDTESESDHKNIKRKPNQNKRISSKSSIKEKPRNSKRKVQEYSSNDEDTISEDTETNEEEEEEEEEEENQEKDQKKKEMNEDEIRKEISEIEDSLRGKWNGSLTLEQLKKLVDGEEEEVTSRIRILKSKKSCKIVIEEKKEGSSILSYRINKKCEAPDSSLTLPFIFSQLAEKDNERAKATIIDNRDIRLDAAVVRVLKDEKSIDQDFLCNKVQNLVKFKFSRDFFETRLKKLELNRFLKIDHAGKVHYIS